MCDYDQGWRQGYGLLGRTSKELEMERYFNAQGFVKTPNEQRGPPVCELAQREYLTPKQQGDE